VPPAPGPRAASSPPAPAGDLIQKGRILVTKEEYQKTFDDIRQLIEQLNQIIAARDYEAWTEHLTSEYVRTYSNPQTLSLISNQPMLVRQNLRIASLKDYFLYVVVPSRANARLDDLEFINKTQVKAITVIGGKRYILYNLRFEDGSWKIAVSS
jgi:Icc-related predicted phosphoesterase